MSLTLTRDGGLRPALLDSLTQGIIAGLTQEASTERILWEPLPGAGDGPSPQERAYHCEADELFYGGAAGGGKSDLLLGLALTAHRSAVIFRREFPQLEGLIERSRELIGGAGAFNGTEHLWRLNDGRRLKFAAVQYEQDKQKYQGRARDFVGFDELPHFTQSQYEFLIAWNRTADATQTCRVVAAGNPPAPGQAGEWIIQAWAPWLDPTYTNPAEPGELRWYAMLDGRLAWVDGPTPFEHESERGGAETIYPKSRSFIPARVQDNPYLMASGYVRTLQALPEPLRSQLLYGDFNATAEDDPWQCIPTAWALQAMERWRARSGPDVHLSCVGVDPARGGKDQMVLAPRFGDWFAPLQKHAGRAVPDGKTAAALVVGLLGDETAAVNIDPIAIGSSPLDILTDQGLTVNAVNFSEGARDADNQPLTDRSGRYKFRNVRAAAYWRLREALDPVNGDSLALPDDRELLGDLCAPRYSVSSAGIQIEAKEELRERLGRSPDCGDAVVLAHWQPPGSALGPLTAALASTMLGGAGLGGWNP